MEVIMPHPFPMIRGGGLFLICVGGGFLLGWFIPRYWVWFAIGGFISGFIGSSFSPLLGLSLGIPTSIQISALIGAIIFEVVLILFVLRQFQNNRPYTDL